MSGYQDPLSGGLAVCDRVRLVGSFDELQATPFAGEVNALCWPRSLAGDFGEIVSAIGPLDEITTLEEDDLQSLSVSPSGALARQQLLSDLVSLKTAGLAPSLDCIPAYPRSPVGVLVPVDVYDFHVDSASILADTYLCTYAGAPSEGLPNEAALRYVDMPEIRMKLLQEYGGADDARFSEYLAERFYDLHYAARAGAQAYSFGLGNMWRIATRCQGSPVQPCIHRAPTTLSGDLPRLLLIS